MSTEKLMQRAITRRIAACNQYLRDHNLVKLPDDLDIDKIAPGTAKHLGEDNDDKMLKLLATRKAKQDGLIGIRWLENRYQALFHATLIGSYKTAAEAAEAYNEAARAKYGDRAVLCDLRAARRYEKRMSG